MEEGDRDFRLLYRNISLTVKRCSVPVIVKEVGFGLSRETAQRLAETGVAWLDVGGAGGTNFLAIEGKRHPQGIGKVFLDWGINTAASLLEVRSAGLPYKVVASGGIRNGLDIAKALALGANMAGMAGVILEALIKGSYKQLLSKLDCCQQELTAAMMLCNAANIEQLNTVPLVVRGGTREWCLQRGIAL